MKKAKWLVILLAVALALIPASSALADSSQDVTVTATPLYLSITNITDDAGTAWTINGLGGGTERGIPPHRLLLSQIPSATLLLPVALVLPPATLLSPGATSLAVELT